MIDIVAAEYVDADHTELIYTTKDKGSHRIRRDENPSFWHHVLQMVVIKDHSNPPGYYDGAGRMIMKDVTPLRAVPAQPPPTKVEAAPQPRAIPPKSDLSEVRIRVLQERIEELEAELANMQRYWEVEIAAEIAIIAGMPDDGVDPVRKREAQAILAEEAKIRGLSVDEVARQLLQERASRNAEILSARLSRLVTRK